MVQGLRFLVSFAVLAVLVFVRVTHVTLLVMLLLLSVTTVVEVNGYGRRAGSGAVAGFGQQARCERAEAGSCLDSDVSLSVRVENPSARVARVNTALHQNSYSTPARSLHDVHVARCVQNSMNSLGDRVVRGRGFCVPKSLSTCARTGVRRSAVEKLASPQQGASKVA